MTVRTAPPLPRSGRLMTGGANALGLLWALLALAAIGVAAAVSVIAWVAVCVEAHLAGTGWSVPVTQMHGLLVELATGSRPEALADAIAQAWRPLAVAATLGVTVTAAPLNPPLLLMLDEAGNIAPLQTLPKIAATAPGRASCS